MKVDGTHFRTIWFDDTIKIIDQRREYLPHKFEIRDLNSVDDFCIAIKDMWVRGAGLIGATAGYGMFIGAEEAGKKFQSEPYTPEKFDQYMQEIGERLKKTRPTAANLAWAVNRQLEAIRSEQTRIEKVNIAFDTAEEIADEDAEYCKRIGEYGVELIKKIYERKKSPVNILTHCNAGWLAFVDYGSATSPIYEANRLGIPVHVWVDMTAPWNQGGRLTAWELANEGIPHHIIADNTGGHLMQHGLVDIVITGADRVTRTGDAANKIGTYLKAIAAKDNNVPFYVALPSSTFDWKIKDGINEIPIEERDPEEVKYAYGLCEDNETVERVLIANSGSPAKNYSFDVTPARFITGLITERGICQANEEDILRLYPEHK